MDDNQASREEALSSASNHLVVDAWARGDLVPREATYTRADMERAFEADSINPRSTSA